MVYIHLNSGISMPSIGIPPASLAVSPSVRPSVRPLDISGWISVAGIRYLESSTWNPVT